MRSMITRGMGHFTNRTGLCVALAAALALAGCSSSGEPAPDEAAARPDPTGPPIEGMVLVRGGVYAIGSEDGETDERPARRILLDPFYLDAREVTNAEFARFVEATGYRAEGEWKLFAGAGRERHPVVSVTWRDAAAFAAWAGKRLPTEAEWEFAARGGQPSQTYTWGEDKHPAGKWMANTWSGDFPVKNTKEDGFVLSAPVKSFPPNGYGLYDLSGNVWEWTSDWYRPDYYANSPRKNPTGPADSRDPDEPGVPKRVSRGGSFLCSDEYCIGYQPGIRSKSSPDTALQHTGFRCVKSGPQK
jgi:sulfatase modifying factor 1